MLMESWVNTKVIGIDKEPRHSIIENNFQKYREGGSPLEKKR